MDFSEACDDKLSLEILACMGCLNESSELRKINNQSMVAWYCETVQIPIIIDNLSLSLCWECMELLEKIIKFKTQVKQAYEALQNCSSALKIEPDDQHPDSPTQFESVAAPAPPCDEVKTEADDTSFSPTLNVRRKSKSTLRKHKVKRKPQPPTAAGQFQCVLTPSGDKRYQCDMCAATFMRPSQVATHRRVHTGEKPYKCDQCDSAFRQIQHLRTHRRTHSDERPFKCDNCDAAFKLLQHLAKHNRIHTGEKPYSCDLCDVSFRQQAALVSHRRIHTGDKPYQCDLCGRAFRVRSALTAHQAAHEGLRRYACDLCDSAFATSTILKVHRRVHTCERPFTCDICGVSFKQSGDMRSHRKSKHSV